MPNNDAVCPSGHAGDGYRVVRDGTVAVKDGRKQLWRCHAPDGSSHRFRDTAAATACAPTQGTHGVRCPRPGHKDAVIQSRGTRATSTGQWRRFTCVRPNGEKHTFRVMVSESEGAAPVAASRPPACGEHPDSKVTRAGTYGARNRRQRYRCHPVDGSKAHQFTPRLSREAVTEGEQCVRCDELLSVHHGPITAARHTPWSLAAVAQALNDLSPGASYADVSLALRASRDAVREHLAHAHGIIDAATTPTPSPATSTSSSHSRKERRNAWRVAADLCEQYAPPLFADIEAVYRAQAQARREANDAALAANPDAALTEPLVYVLDELPIWTQAPGHKRITWNVLTVVDVRWVVPADPMTLPERVTRLRLARAFARSTADAWRLVLDELGVRPDFIVADNGPGLVSAVAAHYGTSVGVVPSLWHIHTNIRDALLRLPNTTYLDGKEKVLIDPLRKHLARLARDELIGRTAKDIKSWWEELEALVLSLPAPVSTIRNQRDMHEPRLLAASPILTANPHVPASNAAVEMQIRVALKPFLENRSHLFGNAERTNRLLNLLVCRQAGMFANLDNLALRIRRLNEDNGGWAPAPRQVLDTQPRGATRRTRRYTSLTSHAAIVKLAKDKGIPTTAQTVAAAPPPLLSKQRPATAANLPIREWARTLGLPGKPTGPIRASVKAAYEAAQAGADADTALAVYDRCERERLARNAATRDESWTYTRERDRQAELAPIRAWAAANDIKLSRKGIIPAHIVEAYQAAQAAPTRRRRPSKRVGKAQP